MNKRIRELAEQTGISVEYLTNTKQWVLVEELSKLIVQECTSITDDLVNRNADGAWTSNELYTDYNGALFEVQRRIQETFGVE